MKYLRVLGDSSLGDRVFNLLCEGRLILGDEAATLPATWERRRHDADVLAETVMFDQEVEAAETAIRHLLSDAGIPFDAVQFETEEVDGVTEEQRPLRKTGS